jgi:acetoacetate decarboxylase
MPQNRWVSDASWRPAATPEGPVLPSLEAVYLTDPAVLAAVLPPPLQAPPEPRVHVRVTNIDLPLPNGHRHQEKVGFFAVDAVYEGTLGEYPLMIPIDLESAVAISRERFGEPKKLADIEMSREGSHVEPASPGTVWPSSRWSAMWQKNCRSPTPTPPRSSGSSTCRRSTDPGFDAGPLLVRVDQVRTPDHPGTS